MKRENKVYIIGHKNPDTDSICSAIAYADIKNRTEKGTFVAKRAGQINEETEYVLKRFGVRAPGYLSDAGTQVREIEIHEVKGVPGTISVKKAWESMREQNVVTLPITTEDECLEGLITVSDIAKSYMDAYDSSVMSQAKTQYRSIAETLDGSVIVGNEHGYFVKGRVVIGAFHPDTMENYIHEDDLVILGNRAEDQLCAIEMNASCLVVGLGAKVSRTIQKLAEEMSCVIISTPHDTYTIARLINQSIPIKHLMTRENIIYFHTSDMVDTIKEVMKKSRHRDYPILNKKGKYIGTISRRNLISSRKKQLILVDHNHYVPDLSGEKSGYSPEHCGTFVRGHYFRHSDVPFSHLHSGGPGGGGGSGKDRRHRYPGIRHGNVPRRQQSPGQIRGGDFLSGFQEVYYGGCYLRRRPD